MLVRREGVVRASRAGRLNGCSQGVIQSLSASLGRGRAERVMDRCSDEPRASLIKRHSHQGSHVVAGILRERAQRSKCVTVCGMLPTILPAQPPPPLPLTHQAKIDHL